MKNKEKYKKIFSEYEMHAEDAPWHDAVCRGKECKGCIKRFIEWSEQEAHPGLTDLEEKTLKTIRFPFKYIARDKDGKLFAYYGKPKKYGEEWVSDYPCIRLKMLGMLDWIRFEDVEPWRIDDLVKCHEIMMNEDIKK